MPNRRVRQAKCRRALCLDHQSFGHQHEHVLQRGLFFVEGAHAGAGLGQLLQQGAHAVTEMVESIYASYPKLLYPAAGQSVTSHLIKLEAEGRVQRIKGENDGWSLVTD